jgi:ATP-dependent helicase YprA (DUF1998 family)
MQSMRGLQHETSVQAAQERSTTFSAASLAGQKRHRSDADAAAGPRSQISTVAGEVRFQRAISLPRTPTRLHASKIVDLESSSEPSEWSQRKIIAATPTSTVDPELSLNHPTYGLPLQLVQNLASLGIKQIYPWQKNCLKGPGLLKGEKNLVYCAPTGGGKSLVADCKPDPAAIGRHFR